MSPKMQHEAGHFLVAYLVGILPRGYTLSSLEALQKEGSLNIQAGTAFVDYEFLEEVHHLSFFPLSLLPLKKESRNSFKSKLLTLFSPT